MNGEILKYFDLFGTKSSFYTEFKPKLYTKLGGILSALSIITCITVFILMNIIAILLFQILVDNMEYLQRMELY